jgi:Spy/CpxP family protein refolding chaperone
MRAVMDPELNLAREQRQEIREAMRAHMASIRSGELTEEQEKEALARLQEELLAKLTPEQRAKAEAKLEELKKRDPWKKGARPGRRGGTGTAEDEPEVEEEP